MPKQLLELRETLSPTGYLKEAMKDTEEEPDGEICRGRSRRVLRAGASLPVELGCFTLPVVTCWPTWKLSEPPTPEIFWKFPHIGTSNY